MMSFTLSSHSYSFGRLYARGLIPTVPVCSGPGATLAGGSAPPPPSSTAYSAVKADQILRGPVFCAVGRVQDGACRASGDNAPGEAAAKVFDGKRSRANFDQYVFVFTISDNDVTSRHVGVCTILIA